MCGAANSDMRTNHSISIASNFAKSLRLEMAKEDTVYIKKMQSNKMNIQHREQVFYRKQPDVIPFAIETGSEMPVCVLLSYFAVCINIIYIPFLSAVVIVLHVFLHYIGFAVILIFPFSVIKLLAHSFKAGVYDS